MSGTDDPFVLTLALDPTSFRRLDDLRGRYFPPARNVVPAHVSLFHNLPGSEFDAIDRELRRVSAEHPAFSIRFGGLKPMGGGFLAGVESPGLAGVRADLARAFQTWLTPQDRQPFRPHVTIMNKAGRDEARHAFAEASASWAGWEGVGEGLLLWHYRGGPWELAVRHHFGGVMG